MTDMSEEVKSDSETLGALRSRKPEQLQDVGTTRATPDGKENDVERCFSSSEVREDEVGHAEVVKRQESVEVHRKKHRRGRKKWRPYNRLSWQEKEVMEDRKAKRAKRSLKRRAAQGRPNAPSNTTQFLMNEHDNLSPNLEQIQVEVNQNHSHHHHHTRHATEKNSGGDDNDDEDDDDDFYSSPDDESDFLRADFAASYDTMQDERLQSLTREQLIDECRDLEHKLTAAQNEHRHDIDMLEGKLAGVSAEKAQLAVSLDFQKSLSSLVGNESVAAMSEGEVKEYAARLEVRCKEESLRCKVLEERLAIRQHKQVENSREQTDTR